MCSICWGQNIVYVWNAMKQNWKVVECLGKRKLISGLEMRSWREIFLFAPKKFKNRMKLSFPALILKRKIFSLWSKHQPLLASFTCCFPLPLKENKVNLTKEVLTRFTLQWLHNVFCVCLKFRFLVSSCINLRSGSIIPEVKSENLRTKQTKGNQVSWNILIASQAKGS